MYWRWNQNKSKNSNNNNNSTENITKKALLNSDHPLPQTETDSQLQEITTSHQMTNQPKEESGNFNKCYN